MTENFQYIYTERKTVVGVLIGGPIAGAYYFWQTFMTVGMSRAALISPFAAAILLAITLGSAFVPAFDRLPNVLFWSLQIGLTYGLFRGYLAKPVEAHVSEGKREFSWGNTIAVAMISLVFTLAIMVAALYLAGAFNGPSVRYFGSLRHEIAYDKENLTDEEVDQMGRALIKTGYFDQEVQKTVDLTKDTSRYILNFYCNETARNPEFFELVKGLRQDIQFLFTSNPIVIDLVIGTPDNRIARIE